MYKDLFDFVVTMSLHILFCSYSLLVSNTNIGEQEVYLCDITPSLI